MQRHPQSRAPQKLAGGDFFPAARRNPPVFERQCFSAAIVEKEAPVQLDGKCALVTGAGHGIGRAIVRMIAQQGADVAALDIDPEALSATRAEVEALGRRCIVLEVDVTERDRLLQALESAAGGLGRIDILINNVGRSARERAAPFQSFDPVFSDYLVRLCLQVTMDCAQYVLPGMIERGYGKIVNIASDSAFTGSKSAAPYAAAKAGVLGFTRSLAKEVARNGITVNAIAPGWIRTRATDALPAHMVEQAIRETPMGVLGEPEDIANAALFFASSMSRYVTGQTLIVNGGRWMI
jgi:acetoacetyl-CoA reductase/3-oxoacyl-[acyl-carrier protein] reductase